jgi:hypothetical protein
MIERPVRKNEAVAAVDDRRGPFAVGQTNRSTGGHQPPPTKNLHPLDKTENEGIQRIPFRTRGTGWPHPSLDGEVDPALGKTMTSTVKSIS